MIHIRKKHLIMTALLASAMTLSALTGCSKDPSQENADTQAAEAAAGTAKALPDPAGGEQLTSQAYVEAMGHGWNLGNSFDGVDTDQEKEDEGETAWGNPKVTRELIRAVKAKGFQSIRIPMTLARRYGEDESCTIDEDWLARYKEVVDWAVEEGLYVMVNIHHDSWIWLKEWDGDTQSEEYVRFVKLWEQLAGYFKDEPEQVCFETINEPDFVGSDEEKQEKLDAVNLAAYHAIRESGGKNGDRMIVMPTLSTSFEKCDPLLALIQSLDDDHIIATVHYYGEWVYSANLGITGFDEVIDDTGKTARTAAENAMSTVRDAFTKNGIGVVVGEYGLLGYDKSERCDQPGEELKYYEYMNQIARDYGLCLMFWDNGSGIDRTDKAYPWKKPLVGEMLEVSMEGRSSYCTELDTLFLDQEITEDLKIPLTLNGNAFVGIEGLQEGEDYTYDEQTETVLLSAAYVNGLLSASDGYGLIGEVVLQFDGGAPWHEKLVRCGTPVFDPVSGTTEGLTIPASYNGAELRRIAAFSGEDHTGPHSDWWKYLEDSCAYYVEEDALLLDSRFFDECAEGEVRLVIEFFDGQVVELQLTKEGDNVRVR